MADPVEVPTGSHVVRVVPEIYGDWDLRRDDKDEGHVYAGAERVAPENVPEDGETGYVEELQTDLDTLGFKIVGTPDGEFLRKTEWAVREFQIYAKMENVAEEAEDGSAPRYVDNLSQVANDDQYTGPVSGVVNAETRRLIKQWIRNRWRCPVVIEAWNMASGSRTSVHTENIWGHDDVSTNSPRMFARDFSGYYDLPAGRNADDLHVIGDWTSYSQWSGPRSVPPKHTWSEGEMTAERLTGTAYGSLTGSTLSTFKVVRAVSEVECIGYFDSVNSYDNAFVSVGPCHWTLGIAARSGSVSEGELCGYLAYLRSEDSGAFEEAFEFFGMRVDEDWGTDGSNLYKSGSRKYAGWVALQQEDGSYARVDEDEDEGDYFKTWHWFYRFVMAGRCVNGYRTTMWDMARMRLRDIRGAGGLSWRGSNYTVGDIYTSERAMAMILRWHIRYPAHMVSGGNAGARLQRILGNASRRSWDDDPANWGDDEEEGLVDAILANSSSGGPRDTLERVRDWPSWATGGNPRDYSLDVADDEELSTARDSFDLDDSGIGAAP